MSTNSTEHTTGTWVQLGGGHIPPLFQTVGM